jgi:signal transduction histidine kinase
VADKSDSLGLVTKISAGVKRLEGLVSQVLHFTRDIAASPCHADLAAIVAESVELSAGAMAAKNVTCRVDGPRALGVMVDATLIGQALLNLLLNAADATPPGGRVTVTFAAPSKESGARQFHLVVRDTGAGIEPAVLDRIFNPFFTTKDTGTGLGLAIVHRVVEAHDGTITAGNADDDDDQGGGGARFEIRI